MVFQCFLIFSLTARKPPKSSEIGPKSFQHRAKIAILAAFGGLLGAILALLGAILAHLGALGRHLGSSWGSWAPSCCQRCRNIAPTCAKTAQIRSNIAQNDRHRCRNMAPTGAKTPQLRANIDQNGTQET